MNELNVVKHNDAERSTRLLRLKQVINLTGLSRSTVYALMNRNQFPHSFPIGYRAVAWLEKDVEKWIHHKIATRQLQPISRPCMQQLMIAECDQPTLVMAQS